MKKTTTFALSAVVAALALAGCQKNADEKTAGEKLDGAMARVEQKADEVKADAKQESAETNQTMRTAADNAGDKVKDAGITTSINAELAKDSKLSALRINVDTVNGRVVLRGTAPDQVSKDRATTLAGHVDGVVSVDNQLNVGSPS